MLKHILFLGATIILLVGCAPTSVEIKASNRYIQNDHPKSKLFVLVTGNEEFNSLSDGIGTKIDSIFSAHTYTIYVYKPGQYMDEIALKKEVDQFNPTMYMAVNITEGKTINGKPTQATYQVNLYDAITKTKLYNSFIKVSIGADLIHTWSDDGTKFATTLYQDLLNGHIIQ